MIVRRPGMPASPPRSLVGDRIRRDSIQGVRIDDHLRVSQGKWGSAPGMRRWPFSADGPSAASSEVGETWPPEPASGYTAQAERTATCAHVGSGAIRRAAGGRGWGDHQPACPALPGRAVVLLVILVGPWDTRCWPCSPGVQQAPVIARAGIRPSRAWTSWRSLSLGAETGLGRLRCGLDCHRPRRWLASGQVDRVARPGEAGCA